MVGWLADMRWFRQEKQVPLGLAGRHPALSAALSHSQPGELWHPDCPSLGGTNQALVCPALLSLAGSKDIPRWDVLNSDPVADPKGATAGSS